MRWMCRNDGSVGKTVTLAGPQAYTVDEVIGLCEKYAGAGRRRHTGVSASQRLARPITLRPSVLRCEPVPAGLLYQTNCTGSVSGM